MKLTVAAILVCLLVATLTVDDSEAWPRIRLRLRSAIRRVGDAIRRIRVRRVVDKVCAPLCRYFCTAGICRTVCGPACGLIGRKRRATSELEKNRIPFPTKLSDYDLNNDGLISPEEFVTRLHCTHESCKSAFMIADKNGDEFIDHIEFVLAPFDKSEKQKFKENDDIEINNEEELEELIEDGLEDGLQYVDEEGQGQSDEGSPEEEGVGDPYEGALSEDEIKAMEEEEKEEGAEDTEEPFESEEEEQPAEPEEEDEAGQAEEEEEEEK